MASSSSKDEKKTGRYVHKDKHKINTYNKKILLGILEDRCDETTFQEVQKRLPKIKPESIEDYVNCRAFEAQLNVHEECNLPLFQSLNKWAEYFKEVQLSQEAKYDLSLAFKVIAETESHPSPNAVNDVNFNHLYTFLADVMRGDPTVQLDEPTRDFLKEVFEELLSAADSDTGVADCKKLEKAIEENANIITIIESRDEFPRALDPLNIEV